MMISLSLSWPNQGKLILINLFELAVRKKLFGWREQQ